jgi:hypothetical protein
MPTTCKSTGVAVDAMPRLLIVGCGEHAATTLVPAIMSLGRARTVDYRLALARNLVLGVAALAAAGGAGPAGDPSLGAPVGTELIPALLAGVGIVVGVWVVARSMRWLAGGVAAGKRSPSHGRR